MKTRAAIFGTLFSLFMIQSASGQIQLGVRSGVQFNDMTLTGIGILDNVIPEPQMMAGATASLVATMPLNEHLAFETGIGYARKGFRMQESMQVDLFGINVPIGATATPRIDYLELPLMLKVQSSSGPARFFIKGGPYVGYAMDGDIKLELNSILDVNLGTIPFNVNGALYNEWEFGLKAGAGVEVATGPSGAFIAEVNFTHGLTDVLDEPILDIRMKNVGVGLSLGYAMNF